MITNLTVRDGSR